MILPRGCPLFPGLDQTNPCTGCVVDHTCGIEMRIIDDMSKSRHSGKKIYYFRGGPGGGGGQGGLKDFLKVLGLTN